MSCTLATSEPPKVVQNAGVFCILTCKCAWRHKGVPFFDSFSTPARQKVARARQFFDILTWKCASRSSGVPFFDIWTSKSGPRMVCFVHFDFQMCLSLQRRAIFRHPSFKKCSEPVFAFWLENVLLATAACNFSTSQLQKCPEPVSSWKCASRYSGLQFFISPLNSDLRTRRFSEPTFRPSRPTNHRNNTAFCDFPNISRVCILFLLTLLLFSAFHLLTLLLCSAFSTVHIVGS